MDSSDSAAESKARRVRGAVAWLGSSIFGLAGTVLLICWLLAYALEPDGGFARVGLVLAIAAYGIDLVREEVSGYRERAGRRAGLAKSGSGASAAKAA
jgi:hypothetical protein